MNNLVELSPLRQLSLDELWAHAERLGNINVRPTMVGFDGTGQRKQYEVTLTGRRKNAIIKIERLHESIHCALADAINEAMENGLG